MKDRHRDSEANLGRNVILVDGHNLIGRTPGLSLSREEEGREEILRWLSAAARPGRQRVVVVFDGNRSGSAKEDRFGAVSVVFAPAGRSADEEILRRAGAGNPASTTVVTSDRALALRARGLGCQVESCEAFRKRLVRPERQPPEKPEASASDADEWLAAFAQRASRHKM